LLGNPDIQLAGPELIDQGRVRLQIQSVPGERYLLQSSLDLVTWQDVLAKVALDCRLAFTNDVAAQPVQFYRMRRF
jgi:hypothetical protein